jgi:hypothetical protein
MLTFKKLIVCGDSYQTPSLKQQYLHTHWSQVLADKLGLELLTFAYQGQSNTAISFQILDAAKYRDAIVVISPSAGIRIEWCKPENLKSKPQSRRDFVRTDNKYPEAFINVLSMSMCDINNPVHEVFLGNINLNLEQFKQECMLYYALGKLKNSGNGILFLNSIPHAIIQDTELLQVINNKQLVTKEQFDIGEEFIDSWVNKDIDPGYHTTPKFQLKLADYIEHRIKEYIQ